MVFQNSTAYELKGIEGVIMKYVLFFGQIFLNLVYIRCNTNYSLSITAFSKIQLEPDPGQELVSLSKRRK